VESKEEVEQVATISANQEKDIGGLIAAAMEKVGKEGVITVTDGKTLHHEIEVIEGMKFDQGYLSRYFMTNQKNQKCEMDNVHILIADHKISTVQALVPVLELAAQQRIKLVIICENVEGDALATLIINKLKGMPVVAVKAPGFGDNRKNYLQDIAVLTGGEVISEELGLKIDKVELSQLGRAKRIEISADDTIILDGAGTKPDIEDRCEQIRNAMSLTTSDYEKDKLKERLGKLSGGVAVIKVGGASEVEVAEIKDRITDSLNATRAAVEEGIVAGGGAALLHASKILDEIQLENFDQRRGLQILRNALRVPCQTIADNAGVQGALVVGKLLESNDPNFGYDAQEARYVNMLKAGIIDPAKVVRTALVDAASVASLMTTTEAIVVELPKPESSMPAGGGMGGMGGGMDY